ncbi:MAG: glycerate kinase, partial [Myxococcota bacterium]|nr:glycerate kinase [Myxococcota bacterium]
EVALDRFAEILTASFGRDPRTETGAGAAGGFAGGLWSACGALIRTGVHVVAELVDLEGEVAQADLVITGEGRLDEQTGEGKLVAGIQSVCARHDVPLVVVAGQITEMGRHWCDQRGVQAFELGDPTHTTEERIRRAPEFLERSGRQVMERLVALRDR